MATYHFTAPAQSSPVQQSMMTVQQPMIVPQQHIYVVTIVYRRHIEARGMEATNSEIDKQIYKDGGAVTQDNHQRSR